MALIEALRQVPQTRIVLVDCFEESVGRYLATRFLRAPMLKDEEAFLGFIERACKDEAVDMVLPSTELELAVLSRGRARLERTGAVVMVSGEQVLAIGKDKLLLHAWLVGQGLPALPTAALPTAPGLSLPLLGKPRGGWGGRGVVTLRTPADRDRELKVPTDAMAWQPLLEDFTEVSVDFAIDVQGRVSPLSARSRLRTVAGFALIGQPVADLEILGLAQQTADALAADSGLGVFNLQFLCKDDRCWVSDLNPRVGTSMPLSLAAGHNPVAFLLGAEAPAALDNLVERTFRVLRERAVFQLALQAVRGVVIDLDDTLLDQKDWIVRKLLGAWQVHQAELPSQSNFLQVAIWLLEEGHRADLIDAICLRLGLPERLRPLLIDSYRTHRPSACRLYDDVLPVLTELRRRGYRLALLTDNPAASQRQKLDVSGLVHLFDALTLTGDLGCTKPDVRAFDTACHALNVPAAQAVMVGDNLFRDSLGALDAGLAHAFHIQHDGAMFNFASRLHDGEARPSRLTRIHSLHELLWHLKGPQT